MAGGAMRRRPESAAPRNAAVARGEAAYQAALRQRRIATLVGVAVLFACLLASAWVSEVRPATLATGLPRAGEYFERLLPTLRWATLFAGTETDGSLAAWFYRLDSWA